MASTPYTNSSSVFVGGGSPVLVGTTSATTVGFFGTSPAAQPAMSANAAVATTAAINSSISSSCFGYTSAQATAIINLVNGIRSAGVTLGLWST